MKKREILFYSFAMLVTIVLTILVFNIAPKGINADFNLTRIDGASKEMMLKGISGAPYWIYSSFFNGYGSASPLFYCDLFLYIPSFLVYLGFDILFSYKIFLTLVMVLSFICMFFSVKKTFTQKLAPIVASTLYMVIVFLVIQLITVKIYSDFTFFVFLPLVFAGIYSILIGEKNKKDIVWLAIGMSGLAFSQIMIADIVGIIIVIVFLINFKKWIKARYKIKYLILSLIFMFGISSYYTLPLMEQITQPNLSWKNILPSEFEGENLPLERGEVLTSNNEKLRTSLNRTRYTFDFKYRKNKEDDTYIELPLVMYKGYVAIDENTDRKYKVQVSENGLVQVNVNSVFQGDVTVFYLGTEIQNYSVFVSTISFMVLLGYVYWKKEGEKC